ncbi:hypothetical protein PoB_001045000 [Plakobranchus ocellatus]|uniref:Uncharacterized protein n=1 Tax=Plakobranchus ocellatus TaxID=259542 RepID=A0AAV3YLF0_9GAST|nr:hypothetical protein PoB_001045000 [Plakobranchus ocellatus]
MIKNALAFDNFEYSGIRLMLLLEAKSNMLEELFTSENYDWIGAYPQQHCHHKDRNLGFVRGVGGTLACESALRSAGTPLSRVRAPPSAPRPDGGP